MFSDIKLFKGLAPEEIDRALAATQGRSYGHKDVIALAGSRPTQLILLIEGTIAAEASDTVRNKLTVERIEAPAIIAPTYLFAENGTLPATLVAHTPVRVRTLAREDFVAMMASDTRILVNFLEIVSNPKNDLSERARYVNYRSIRQKFANYLLDAIESEENNSFRNKLTQEQMADIFGVSRPALAKVIGEMAAEGTIFVRGKEITVRFPEKLKHYAKN